MRAYRAEAIIVATMDDAMHPALCFIAHSATADRPFDDYVDRIVTAARRHHFPESYLRRLDQLR